MLVDSPTASERSPESAGRNKALLRSLIVEKGSSVLRAVESAVSELGTELSTVMGRFGHDLDTWGSTIGSSADEFFPSWETPPRSAVTRSTRAVHSGSREPRSQLGKSMAAVQREGHLYASPKLRPRDWDEWSWSDAACEADDRDRENGGSGASPQLIRAERAPGSAWQRRPALQEVSLSACTDCSNSRSCRSLPASAPYEETGQLELTVLDLLRKQTALTQENARLASENKNLQLMLHLAALREMQDGYASDDPSSMSDCSVVAEDP